jgi:polyisoprenoid-binding protein YceI
MTLVRLLVSSSVLTVLTLGSMSQAVAADVETTAAVYTVNQAASSIGFTISGSKMFFKFKRDGQFKNFNGELSYDPAHPANAHVDLTVYTASVDMHDSDNNQLLKSGEFFDVDHFPTMHFTSSATAVRPDGTLEMIGDMTIRGVTKKMTIPIKLRQDSQSAAAGAVFETTFPIDRTDFGLNGNPAMGGFSLKISKSVQIHIAIATATQTARNR